VLTRAHPWRTSRSVTHHEIAPDDYPHRPTQVASPRPDPLTSSFFSARPASTRPDPLTSGSFIGHRLPSQTNISLFCAFYPHSCAFGKNFPVGHPSRNCSRPSTLNFGVLSNTRVHPGRIFRSVTHLKIAPGQARLTLEFFRDRLPKKKLQLVDMSIISIILSPGPGYHTELVIHQGKCGLRNQLMFEQAIASWN